MQVNVDINERDIAELVRYHDLMRLREQPPSARRQLIPIGLSVLMAIVAIAIVSRAETYWEYVPFYLIIAASVALPIWLERRKKWSHWREARKWIAEHSATNNLFGRSTITISPNGVSHAGRLGLWECEWPSVSVIHRHRHVLYIYFEPEGVIIVPARSFPAKIDFQRFGEACLDMRRRFIIKPPTPDESSALTSVRYSVTEEDCLAFFRHQNKTTRKGRWAKVGLIFGGLAMIALGIAGMWLNMGLVGLAGESGSTAGVSFLFILIGILILIVAAKDDRTRAKRRLKEMRKQDALREVLGDYAMRIGPDAVQLVTSYRLWTIPWREMRRIERNQDGLYLFVARDFALIVPSRSFATPQDFDNFSRTVHECRDRAPAFEKNCPQCGFDLTGLREGGCPECGWRRAESSKVNQETNVEGA